MKDTMEWMHSWADNADKNDLPRVLLVGDSITNSYYEMVKEILQGQYYVDYIAVSYAIDSPFFSKVIKGFVEDSTYALIHFNNGLHGAHITQKDYASGIEKLLSEIKNEEVQIILASTTIVNEQGNQKISERWDKIVNERNETIWALAKKYNYPVDDLWLMSKQMDRAYRSEDGIHYLPEGAKLLAQKVAESIRMAFNQ